jgi:hypothetical protein
MLSTSGGFAVPAGIWAMYVRTFPETVMVSVIVCCAESAEQSAAITNTVVGGCLSITAAYFSMM